MDLCECSYTDMCLGLCHPKWERLSPVWVAVLEREQRENRNYNLQHLILLISSTHCWEEGVCLYHYFINKKFPICNNTGNLLAHVTNNHCPSAHYYFHILFARQKPNTKNKRLRPPRSLSSSVHVTTKVIFFLLFFYCISRGNQLFFHECLGKNKRCHVPRYHINIVSTRWLLMKPKLYMSSKGVPGRRAN